MPDSILIADDNPDIVRQFASDLRDEYAVRTAYNGEEALASLDSDVDVVLLDRRMADLSGEEVLQEIRNQDLDCRVAMVTAVQPDFDILGMGFDDYLTKPVTTDELYASIERLLTRSQLDTQLQAYFALVSKRSILEEEKSAQSLATNSEFHELTAQIERLEEELDDILADLEFEEALEIVTPGEEDTNSD